jgi:hypothetical protein
MLCWGDRFETGISAMRPPRDYDWNPIETAPFDEDIALRVTDGRGTPYTLQWPCAWATTGIARATPTATTLNILIETASFWGEAAAVAHDGGRWKAMSRRQLHASCGRGVVCAEDVPKIRRNLPRPAKVTLLPLTKGIRHMYFCMPAEFVIVAAVSLVASAALPQSVQPTADNDNRRPRHKMDDTGSSRSVARLQANRAQRLQ